MDGEEAFDHSGAKASIQFAEKDGAWIAEFQFRFRSGLCQARTLPLTTSSNRHASRAKAVGGAALRLLESLRSALAGDTLGKTQQGAADALEAWAQRLVDDRILANRSAPYVFPRGADTSKVVADILGRSPPGPVCRRPMTRLKPDPKGRSQRIEVVGLIDGKGLACYRGCRRVSSFPALNAYH